MYRKTDSKVAALEDACWHRLMPLSQGRLEGDNVACGYHGLVYNPQGRCTFMPSQKTINPSAAGARYPGGGAASLHLGLDWRSRARGSRLVPDLHWNDDPEWAGDGKTIHLKCDYRLVLDNLMDLTHETFVHGASIGTAVAEAPFDVTHGEKTATVTRWMNDIEPPPFWAEQLRKPGMSTAGRSSISRALTIAIDVGVAPTGTGAPEGDRSQGVNGYVLNTITPETEKTCHYFWAFVRNYKLNDQPHQEIREGVTGSSTRTKSSSRRNREP